MPKAGIKLLFFSLDSCQKSYSLFPCFLEHCGYFNPYLPFKFLIFYSCLLTFYMAEPLICWQMQINDCSIRVSRSFARYLRSKAAACKNDFKLTIRVLLSYAFVLKSTCPFGSGTRVIRTFAHYCMLVT